MDYTTIDLLSAAITLHSAESGVHVKRVRDLTEILLRNLRNYDHKKYPFTDLQIHQISRASLLHDIGKIAINDAVLHKPGKLTSEEFEIMKTHTTKGAELLRQIPHQREEPLYQYAYDICLHHHERWDGSGYPHRLKGDKISIWAQVVSVADAIEALNSRRTYKPALPFAQTIKMIERGSCGSFNPELLAAVRNSKRELYSCLHSTLN